MVFTSTTNILRTQWCLQVLQILRTQWCLQVLRMYLELNGVYKFVQVFTTTNVLRQLNGVY